MSTKKNDTRILPEEDMNPVSDEKLNAVSGAGNPWEETKGVPQEPIDKEVRDRA